MHRRIASGVPSTLLSGFRTPPAEKPSEAAKPKYAMQVRQSPEDVLPGSVEPSRVDIVSSPTSARTQGPQPCYLNVIYIESEVGFRIAAMSRDSLVLTCTPSFPARRAKNGRAQPGFGKARTGAAGMCADSLLSKQRGSGKPLRLCLTRVCPGRPTALDCVCEARLKLTRTVHDAYLGSPPQCPGCPHRNGTRMQSYCNTKGKILSSDMLPKAAQGAEAPVR